MQHDKPKMNFPNFPVFVTRTFVSYLFDIHPVCLSEPTKFVFPTSGLGSARLSVLLCVSNGKQQAIYIQRNTITWKCI